MATLLSVNVGRPREASWNGRTVTTGIFKSAVPGEVRVARTQLEGDGQADLSAHGGESKAVYAYPSEHYTFWREQLPGTRMEWGHFGENLTTLGLLEKNLCIGDRLRVGTAEFRVTEPRLPCSKLALRFERHDIIKRFLESRRSGFYLSVERTGVIASGDAIEVVRAEVGDVTVDDVVRLHAIEADDIEGLRRVVDHAALPLRWREHFRKRLDKLTRRGTTNGK